MQCRWPSGSSRDDLDVHLHRYGHQEVEDVVIHAGRRDVDEVVVQRASSRVKTLPKKLIARYPVQDLQQVEVPEACSR